MDLYQELILEHSKRPHGAGLRSPYAAEVHTSTRPAATR
jgi:nitrogen fixation NifU-like protein